MASWQPSPRSWGPPPLRGPVLPVWVLVTALLLAFPLGLVLLWSSSRWRTSTRVLVTAVVLLAVAAGMVGLSSSRGGVGAVRPPDVLMHDPPPEPSARPRAGGPPGLPPVTALSMLAGLVVREQGQVPDYDRTLFGPAWTDTDRNGCDTRNDVLRRDLSDVVLKPGTLGCVVLSGSVRDPYTGVQLQYDRGYAQAVQVDHVVALADAWRSGAHSWPYARRLAFANDPLELLAVSGEANGAKGDSNAAGWLPLDERYHCAFVARQVGVKAKYGLTVTSGEQRALRRVLEDCLGEPAVGGGPPTLAPNRSPAPRSG